MFIATLTFTKTADEVAAFRERHVAWLARLFDNGLVVAAGPRPNGAGGVLFARSGDGATLRATMAEDPYAAGGVATYDITEFTPTRTTAEAEFLKQL